MIEARAAAGPADVARHYDELDPFYRALWGEHLHHGFWTRGDESPELAALALVEEVAHRAGIAAGARVCDIGCGYGAPALLLAGRGAHVTGLTLSAAQHAHASTRDAGGSRPVFLLRDWLDNRLPDESFDAAIAIESLAHMQDRPRALAEALRVLRPGGRLVACVWLAGPDPTPWQVRHLLRPICEEGRLPALPTAADYLEWTSAAGFTGVALEDVSGRVAQTWAVCARRMARGLLRHETWRYLLDRRNTERGFALSVLRLWLAYRSGAMRYGILEARRPPPLPDASRAVNVQRTDLPPPHSDR